MKKQIKLLQRNRLSFKELSQFQGSELNLRKQGSTASTDHEVGEAFVGDVDARLDLEHVKPEVDDEAVVDGDAPTDLRVRSSVGEVGVRKHRRRDHSARTEQLVSVN